MIVWLLPAGNGSSGKNTRAVVVCDKRASQANAAANITNTFCRGESERETTNVSNTRSPSSTVMPNTRNYMRARAVLSLSFGGTNDLTWANILNSSSHYFEYENDHVLLSTVLVLLFFSFSLHKRHQNHWIVSKQHLIASIRIVYLEKKKRENTVKWSTNRFCDELWVWVCAKKKKKKKAKRKNVSGVGVRNTRPSSEWVVKTFVD